MLLNSYDAESIGQSVVSVLVYEHSSIFDFLRYLFTHPSGVALS